ncbi:Lysophospholipase-like protein 1 [Papilio machaon]|uniref:palmitoyl-protein hydrolase n=1 Tax=Papilio machaon TaxID=76193 RepID=A0A194QLV0_PAPMA|nr:Lysophospholipase-like protein 1 [Papilio machaon]
MSKLSALTFTRNTGAKHTATVIFFHGSGANGEHMQEWVNLMTKNFKFPQIKVIYPTAPLQPYTPAGGQPSNVWFDRADINQSVAEKLDSVERMGVQVKELIKSEVDGGIPINRIIVGGFSMGGALSLYTGYRWERNLAGVFAFSSFLNNQSIVYQDLIKSSGIKLPPLLQIHGDNDDLVDLTWGRNTYNELKKYGVNGEFHVMPKLGHSINKRGMNIISDWIVNLLPDV